MATIQEMRRQTQGGDLSSGGVHNRTYMIFDAPDADTAEAALLDSGNGGAPPSLATASGNVILFDWSVVASDDLGSVWEGIANYQRQGITSQPPRDYPETDTEEVSFDIATKSTHITQALDETIYNRAAEAGETDPLAPYPANGGILIEDEDGKPKVKGVDVLTPELTFTITRYQPTSTITDTYVKALGEAVGTTNEKVFRSFEIGELLLIGVSGSPRSNEDYNMSYRFAANPNLDGFDIETIANVSKKGWEYLWIYYEVKPDAAAGVNSKKPRHAIVDRVYEATDFEDVLGLDATLPTP